MDRTYAPVALALAGILSGCTPEGQVLSDYSLTLEPRMPANQEGLFDGQSVSLVLRGGDGETSIEWIDDLSGDRVSKSDFGPLQAARVGVLVERPGGQPTQVDPELLVAYGEAGPFTLSTGGQTAAASFLLTAYGGIGDLDVLPEEAAGVRSAMAMTPDGTTWLFGGAYQLAGSNSGHGFVQKLEPLDNGEWAFDEVSEMPDWDEDGSPDGFVAGTATYIESSGHPYILVTGGRPENAFYTATYQAALWDVEDEEWAWFRERAMQGVRAHHVAMPMQNGNVMFIGGMALNGGIADATVEIYDVDQKAFDVVGTLVDLPAVGFAAADVGPKGVLVCGGGEFFPSPQRTSPRDGCYIVSPAGDIEETEPLPTAVQGLAMAPLGDGRVLACGGLDDLAEFTSPVDAIPDAWIYDPASQTWTTLTSRLNTPRALHQAIPMPDGKVLIVGGVETGVIIDGNVESPVSCNEIFEPDTFTFTQAEPCSAAGSGAEPRVAYHPDHYAVVIEGYGEDQSGGRAYGVVGFPPNL